MPKDRNQGTADQDRNSINDSRNRAEQNRIPILNKDELPFDVRPHRRNAAPPYPWDELQPGQGFRFRAGTAKNHARNVASMNSGELHRQFRVYVSELDDATLYAARVDGLDYLPRVTGDGTKIREVTQRRSSQALTISPNMPTA
jgi:hypothetical protein